MQMQKNSEIFILEEMMEHDIIYKILRLNKKLCNIYLLIYFYF